MKLSARRQEIWIKMLPLSAPGWAGLKLELKLRRLDFLSAKALSQCTRPPCVAASHRLHFFAVLFFLSLSLFCCCSFQLMHTKLVRWQNGRGQHCAALAAFMAYSELIALSFSHFILSVSGAYSVGLYTVLLLLLLFLPLPPLSHTFRQISRS